MRNLCTFTKEDTEMETIGTDSTSEASGLFGPDECASSVVCVGVFLPLLMMPNYLLQGHSHHKVALMM